MLPVDAVPLLGGDVSYTEEVPVRIRWVIADLGGHTVEEAEVLVTTDPENEQVVARLNRRERCRIGRARSAATAVDDWSMRIASTARARDRRARQVQTHSRTRCG